MNKWIRVNDGIAEIMPNEDCEIWIARSGCGKGWIQKVNYHVNDGRINWDGTWAYQLVTEEKPSPYTIHFANGEIVCSEILS